jgi:hypothetical protein
VLWDFLEVQLLLENSVVCWTQLDKGGILGGGDPPGDDWTNDGASGTMDDLAYRVVLDEMGGELQFVLCMSIIALILCL